MYRIYSFFLLALITVTQSIQSSDLDLITHASTPPLKKCQKCEDYWARRFLRLSHLPNQTPEIIKEIKECEKAWKEARNNLKKCLGHANKFYSHHPIN